MQEVMAHDRNVEKRQMEEIMRRRGAGELSARQYRAATTKLWR